MGLPSHASKHVNRMVSPKIVAKTKEGSEDTVCGSIPGRSSELASFTVCQFMKQSKRKRLSWGVLFVDARAAQCSVIRDAVLRHHGLLNPEGTDHNYGYCAQDD